MLKRYIIFYSVVSLCVIFLGINGCGDPTDSPEDCTSNEFFDVAKEVCQTCVAITVPDCRPGCGFTVVNDENKCPIAQCNEACDLCSEKEIWSNDTLSCIAR